MTPTVAWLNSGVWQCRMCRERLVGGVLQLMLPEVHTPLRHFCSEECAEAMDVVEAIGGAPRWRPLRPW